MTTGTVREWSKFDGFGVIDSAETPGGCWAHYSVINSMPPRDLEAGQDVMFTWEEFPQDGFTYRATEVVAPGAQRRTTWTP